ncbi:hypothetical protein RIR_jg10567.t1 [Rhizophagus irregularis DAOM 181602=DAOM 197198]|nr:hypothetical protein RIR_jg10567.t1 [Rhizophagus irregularis DAOM 181602=DAOM 197198]
MCYCCYVSASDTWSLLGFVSGFGSWTFNGSRVSDYRLWMGISVSSWVLIDINFSSWALIGFSFVFGIQGSEPSKVY